MYNSESFFVILHPEQSKNNAVECMIIDFFDFHSQLYGAFGKI